MRFAAITGRGRLSLMLCGWLMLIAVSACTGGPSEEQSAATPTPSPTPSAEPPRPSPTEKATPTPISTEVCEGVRPYNGDSEPYEGKGPHRMTFVQRNNDPDVLELTYVVLPDGWDPEIARDEKLRDRDKVELAVCDTAVLAGPVMGTCTFDQPGMSGKMQVAKAHHTFVVREARTGREVTRFSMPGNEGVEDSCPSVAVNSGGTLIGQAVNDDDVAERLRPLYEGPARKS